MYLAPMQFIIETMYIYFKIANWNETIHEFDKGIILGISVYRVEANYINSSYPGQNGRHFPDNISKCIFDSIFNEACS